MMKKQTAALIAVLLLASAIAPASARTGPKCWRKGNITVFEAGGVAFAFFASGEKPVFAFWAASNPGVVNIVRFRVLSVGLAVVREGEVEATEDLDFAPGVRIASAVIQRLAARIGPPWKMRIIGKIMAPVEGLLTAYRPLGYVNLLAQRWELIGPEEIMSDDGRVVGVTFTLELADAPGPSEFKFVCRLYSEDVVERHGPIEYVVRAGELKVDVILPPISGERERATAVLSEVNELLSKAGLRVTLRRTLSVEVFRLSAASVKEALSASLAEEPPSILPKPVTLAIGERRGAPVVAEERGARPVILLSQEPLSGYFRFVDRALVKGGGVVQVNASAKLAGKRLVIRLHYPLLWNATIVHDPIVGVLKPEIGTNFEDYEAAIGVVEKTDTKVIAAPLPTVPFEKVAVSLAAVTALLAGVMLIKVASREEVEG